MCCCVLTLDSCCVWFVILVSVRLGWGFVCGNPTRLELRAPPGQCPADIGLHNSLLWGPVLCRVLAVSLVSTHWTPVTAVMTITRVCRPFRLPQGRIAPTAGNCGFGWFSAWSCQLQGYRCHHLCVIISWLYHPPKFQPHPTVHARVVDTQHHFPPGQERGLETFRYWLVGFLPDHPPWRGPAGPLLSLDQFSLCPRAVTAVPAHLCRH